MTTETENNAPKTEQDEAVEAIMRLSEAIRKEIAPPKNEDELTRTTAVLATSAVLVCLHTGGPIMLRILAEALTEMCNAVESGKDQPQAVN
ncbi:MAG: hypothetical protein IRZ03_13555 [Acidobacterium ailaaui]|nr:hypothetical protein [Pseudacidobacterium ailaaui]